MLLTLPLFLHLHVKLCLKYKPESSTTVPCIQWNWWWTPIPNLHHKLQTWPPWTPAPSTHTHCHVQSPSFWSHTPGLSQHSPLYISLVGSDYWLPDLLCKLEHSHFCLTWFLFHIFGLFATIPVVNENILCTCIASISWQSGHIALPCCGFFSYNNTTLPTRWVYAGNIPLVFNHLCYMYICHWHNKTFQCYIINIGWSKLEVAENS